jgi:uncharacterized protein (TIGR00725 family)
VPKIVAVIGAAEARPELRDQAFAVGRAIAERGATLICGGCGGVMEAAAHGARSVGGHTIGVLPTYNRADANPHIEFAIATGMGHARNVIIAASADAVIALDGESGTLSEIGLALKLGRPVVAIDAWREIPQVRRAIDPIAAVELAVHLARR